MSHFPKVTLSMIVKNEERYLRGCLESVKDVVDQIVIVDTGSSDNTINIANEFGAMVYMYEWSDDFSAARNYALSKSEGEWILYLDADERLTKDSLDELGKITAQDKLSGCRCLVTSPDDNSGKPHYMKYVRLFRNKKGIKFSGAVHEQIENSLLSNGYIIEETCIEITHLGYNVSHQEVLNKARRNLKLLTKEYGKNKSPYNAFQLGNTYSILEEYENAKEYYLSSVIDGDLKSEYKAHAYLNLSGYELKNHNLDEAIKYINKGLKEDSANASLYLLGSDIYFRLKKSDDAIKYCREAFIRNRDLKNTLSKTALAVQLKDEVILSKGIYYSLIIGNKNYLNYFFNELEKLNKPLYELFNVITNNYKSIELNNEQINSLISPDTIEAFLAMITNYYDKKKALEILKLLKNKFYGNSKFHKILGLLYSENNFFNDAVIEFKESLKPEEKDPSAVLYYISVLINNNQYQEIPELLIFAEREFGGVPEFAEKFEILKKKLSILFNG